MFDRMTDRARKSLGVARQWAQAFRHDYVGTEHMILGLSEQDAGTASEVLADFEIESRDVREAVERLVSNGNAPTSLGQLPFTPSARSALELSLEAMTAMGHLEIGTGHLLIGLLREPRGSAHQVLTGLGVKLNKARERMLICSDALEVSEDDESAQGTQRVSATELRRRLDGIERRLWDLANEVSALRELLP